MSPTPFFLADELTQDVLASWRVSDPATRERLTIFGAIGAVTLLLLLWAMFLRKKRRQHHTHHHSRRHTPEADGMAEAPRRRQSDPPQEKRRRRHSHRRRRPRNPTLAETGGLPPLRPEDPSEPAP
jgi:hypothetical protein